METYKVLEKALALIIRKEDWTTGSEGMDGPRLCALGAIGRVIGKKRHAEVGDSDAGQALARTLSNPSWSSLTSLIWIFNDANPRGHSGVVDLFQRAIRAEKEKAGIPLDITEPSTFANQKAHCS